MSAISGTTFLLCVLTVAVLGLIGLAFLLCCRLVELEVQVRDRDQRIHCLRSTVRGVQRVNRVMCAERDNARGQLLAAIGTEVELARLLVRLIRDGHAPQRFDTSIVDPAGMPRPSIADRAAGL